MAIFRDIKFNTGTCNDRLGAVGTVTGSTFSQKEKGLAIETGASKYIQYDKQLLPNGAFSVVVWAKVKDTATTVSTNGIMGNASTGAGQLIILYSGGVGGATLRLGSNNFKYFNSTLDKNWKCYIFTCNGNSQTDVTDAKMFINAVERASGGAITTGTQDILRSSYTYTGGEYGGGSGGVQMSRMKVYDHVLSLQEINAEQVEFNNAQPINKPKKGFVLNKPTDLSEYKGTGAGQGLVAAYNMQPVGNTLVDISGNGNNGAKIGQLVFNKKGIVGTRNTTGYYSSTPKTIDLNSNFSLNFRVKINTLTEYANIMTQTNTPTSFVWVYFETGGYLLLDQNSGGKCSVVAANYIGEESTFTINFVSATNTTTFYKNGIQLGVPLTTYNPVGARSGVITIGAYPNDTTWNCKNEIQDLRIYNRVLTLQEIKDYNNSFIQPTLLEDFSDAGADNQASVPREWAKTSGSFKVAENVIRQGELVTNGDFSSAGSTGWTLNGTTISGGAAHFVNSIPFTNSIKQNSIFTIGKLYKITFTISNYVSGSIIMFDQNSGATPAVNNNGTFTFNFIPTGTSFSITTTGTNGTFDIDNVSVTEIQPLQTITNGTKYLEAITAGVVATPSNTAYGSWEFDWYKGGNNNTSFQFIDQKIENFSGNSYWSLFTSATNNIGILYSNAFYIMQSSASYVNINTWYRVKITRTTTGLFTVLIKGGSFVPTAGYDGWTLVSVAGGLGTNPVTDNTYTTSNYFVMSLGAGDRVTNIKITNGLSSVSIPPTWLYGDNVLSQFWGDNLGLELWGDNL